MTTITGERFTTISASAGEIYAVEYDLPPKLNILNGTDGEIKIGYSNDFSYSNSVGGFISLPSGGAMNELLSDKKTIYIAAEGSGNVAIERSSTVWHL